MRAPHKPKVGDVFATALFENRGLGSNCKVRVLAVHRLGTMDLEVIRSGNCFRVSGLDYILADDPVNLLQGENP